MNGTTVIIRDRRQITLPALFDWVRVGQAVTIEMVAGKVIMQPFKEEKKVNWDKVYKAFDDIRKSGKQIDSTAFVVKDRESH